MLEQEKKPEATKKEADLIAEKEKMKEEKQKQLDAKKKETQAEIDKLMKLTPVKAQVAVYLKRLFGEKNQNEFHVDDLIKDQKARESVDKIVS